MNKWQPIETAPEVGNIMLWIAGLPWPGYRSDGKTWSRAHGVCNEKDPSSRHITKASHWMEMLPSPTTK